jgi:hypothetical protein
MILEACRENEYAYEYRHGVTSYGAFTFALAQNLRGAARRGRPPSFEALLRQTGRTLTELKYDQHPVLVGPKAVLRVPCRGRRAGGADRGGRLRARGGNDRRGAGLRIPVSVGAPPGGHASRNDPADPQEATGGMTDDFFSYTWSLVQTVLSIQNSVHLHGDDWQRTIYIDTLGVGTTDFDLDDAKKEALVASGRTHTQKYFDWYNNPASQPANRP